LVRPFTDRVNAARSLLSKGKEMFGLFKSRTERFKEQFFSKQEQSAFKIINALNTEMDFLTFYKGKQKHDFLTDTWFERYAFGMIDAVNTLGGLELRAKIGMRVVAMYYVRFLMLEFELDQATALKVFQSVAKFYNTEEGQRDAAILDGGSDGVLVLRGGNAARLLKHFGVNMDDETTPMTQAEMEKLRAFRSRDRWSDNAVRESQKAMKALMAGAIDI
jgi:hypothetical protein